MNFVDGESHPDNPYRAPVVAEVIGPNSVAATDAEFVRREHLNHEASIQGIGSLYLLGGILGVVGIVVWIVLVASSMADGGGVVFGAAELAVMAVVILVMLAMTIFQAVVGWGARKLRPWVKIPMTILAAIGLLGFPIGTLISAYVLYLIHSQKGQVVLSEAYQQVIAETPHIRYKTSIIVKIFLGLLLALILLAVIGAIIGANQ